MMKTPCEKLGYKVGDKFIKVGKDENVFTNGSVIELSRDDGSDCPLFKLVSGERHYDITKAYMDLCYVKKVDYATEAQYSCRFDAGNWIITKDGEPVPLHEIINTLNNRTN